MQRSLVLFVMVTVVALIAVASASQQASARHKFHIVSTQVSTPAVHGKAHTVPLVDPQAHGIPLLNATALKNELTKEVKGPYGENDVIGGMMSGGY